MRSYFLSLCFTLWLTASSLFSADKILVTIAPYRFFVKEIAGDNFDVNVMVPAGSSAHSYEPSPRQMVESAKAKVWFALGESFEPRVIKTIRSMNPEIEVVDLREGVDLIRGACCHCHKGGLCLANGFDPHMWLSPLAAKVQVALIEKTLSKLDPEHSALYRERRSALETKLDQADQMLKNILPKDTPVTILVSHPAFGYMARDYGLYQISIEFEGREPTQKQVLEIVQAAKLAKVNSVFIQEAHPSKGAQVIAEYLGAKQKVVDPYNEDYFLNLKKMAEDFAASRPKQ